jgi:outer membrane receptor for monomeric catechols
MPSDLIDLLCIVTGCLTNGSTASGVVATIALYLFQTVRSDSRHNATKGLLINTCTPAVFHSRLDVESLGLVS